MNETVITLHYTTLYYNERAGIKYEIRITDKQDYVIYIVIIVYFMSYYIIIIAYFDTYTF